MLPRVILHNETSIDVYTSLVGDITLRSIFHASDLTSSEGVIKLRLNHGEKVKGDGVWLWYEVIR